MASVRQNYISKIWSPQVNVTSHSSFSLLLTFLAFTLNLTWLTDWLTSLPEHLVTQNMILEASPVKHNQIGVRRLNMAGAYVPELYVEKQQISIKNLFNLRKVLFALKCATIHVQQANQYFKFSLGQTTVSQYSLHISTSRSMHLRANQRTFLALRDHWSL